MTNTPPTRSSNNSCLLTTATVPNAAPRGKDPTSPMNTDAGYALNQRNPRLEPKTAAIKTANSPAPSM